MAKEARCEPLGCTQSGFAVGLAVASERSGLTLRPSCEAPSKELDVMAEGTIKRLTDKGFGFIENGSDKDLFFHSSSVEGASFDQLREGQRVSYTEARGQKGPCAENVRPA